MSSKKKIEKRHHNFLTSKDIQIISFKKEHSVVSKNYSRAYDNQLSLLQKCRQWTYTVNFYNKKDDCYLTAVVNMPKFKNNTSQNDVEHKLVSDLGTIGLRKRIAHEYNMLSMKQIFSTVKQDIKNSETGEKNER